MKKCPQCEFIYEDDQTLCDMDGVLLVFDSRSLPNMHALATVAAPMPEKGSRRSRMVPAFATFLLMLAIASVYYVSTVRNVAQPSFSAETISTTAVEPPAPAAAESPAAAVVEPPVAEAPVAVRAPGAEPRSKPTAAAPAKKAATQAVPVKPEPKKEDSKVESILKKTGKLIKKPFKF